MNNNSGSETKELKYGKNNEMAVRMDEVNWM